MIIKLVFQGEIHRISKLPESFEALMEYALKSFKERMPDIFTLQYQDCDGDLVMLTNNEDYKAMCHSE